MVASVLQRPTLVPHRNWQPVNVATAGSCWVGEKCPRGVPDYAREPAKVEDWVQFPARILLVLIFDVDAQR